MPGNTERLYQLLAHVDSAPPPHGHTTARFGELTVASHGPYRTLHGNHICVTLSYAFHGPGIAGARPLMVVCGDLIWEELAPD